MQIFDLELWSLQKARDKGSAPYSIVGDSVAHDARGEFHYIAKNVSLLDTFRFIYKSFMLQGCHLNPWGQDAT